MIHVSRIHFRRNRDRRAVEQRSILRGERAPLFRARAQLRQPRAQNRRLHLVEPAVDPDFDVTISIGLSAVAQPRDARGERRIARDDRAAVAERAEILRRIETERAGGAERADRLPRARREMRLAAIFDEREPLTAGERREAPPCLRAGRTGAPATGPPSGS